MIYTKSTDGALRATMKIDARVTRKEYRDYSVQAKRLGYKNLREFMTMYMMRWHDDLDIQVHAFEELG